MVAGTPGRVAAASRVGRHRALALEGFFEDHAEMSKYDSRQPWNTGGMKSMQFERWSSKLRRRRGRASSASSSAPASEVWPVSLQGVRGTVKLLKRELSATRDAAVPDAASPPGSLRTKGAACVVNRAKNLPLTSHQSFKRADPVLPTVSCGSVGCCQARRARVA